MKKQILVYYLFIATTGLCQLPQYHARIFDARNGLSANQINTIFKDGQDFLWIVYNKHIEKFDGRVVQRFAFPESIVHTANDQKNNIWVISNENVYRLAENSMSFEKVPIDSGKGRLLRIFRLPATPLCLMTNSGYYEWSENSNSFRKMNKPFLRGTLRSQITYFDTCNNTIFFPGGQSQL